MRNASSATPAPIHLTLLDLVLGYLLRGNTLRRSEAARMWGAVGLPGLMERIERERGYRVQHRMVPSDAHTGRLEPEYYLLTDRRA